MTAILALITEPTVLVGLPIAGLLGWGIKELISIRERLTRIETHLDLDHEK